MVSGFRRCVNETLFFWDVTQSRLIITDVSGQPVGSHLKGCPLKMGAIGCPETTVITNLRCTTSQKSEDQDLSRYNPTSVLRAWRRLEVLIVCVLCAHGHVIARRRSIFSENIQAHMRMRTRARARTHTHTHTHTQWSRALLEKITGPQLVKKFSVFYGTRRLITAFTRARHKSVS